MCNLGVSSESAAAGGDALLYRYMVREIGQVLTSTVDACRVGSVAFGQINRLFTVQLHISY